MTVLSIDLSNITSKTLSNVEATVLSVAMDQNRYNQSKTAELLGISRGTLRTKLKEYFGDKYVGSRS